MKLLVLLTALSPFTFATISFCPPLGNGGNPIQMSALGSTSPGNGCTQVDQQYDNMNATGSASGYSPVAPGPTGVTLFGVGTTPGTNNIGVRWSGTVGATNNWSASSSGNGSDTWTDIITFEMKPTDGVLIDGATLTLGSLTNIARTNFTITESVCVDSSTFTCVSPVVLPSIGPLSTAQSGNTVHLSFAPTNDIAVQVVLSAVSTANGSKSFTLDTFTTTFDELVPEPSTWIGSATGLAALASLRLRRRS